MTAAQQILKEKAVQKEQKNLLVIRLDNINHAYGWNTHADYKGMATLTFPKEFRGSIPQYEIIIPTQWDEIAHVIKEEFTAKGRKLDGIIIDTPDTISSSARPDQLIVNFIRHMRGNYGVANDNASKIPDETMEQGIPVVILGEELAPARIRKILNDPSNNDISDKVLLGTRSTLNPRKIMDFFHNPTQIGRA